MPTIINRPTQVEACGTKPKLIEEFVGRVNSGSAEISIARMTSPEGWSEPGQAPEFTEYTLILAGKMRVETRAEDGDLQVHELATGEAIQTEPGEWVRYSTPHEGGAQYIAVCTPAFTPESVNRDDAS